MTLVQRLARLGWTTRRFRGPAHAAPDTALERLRRARAIPLFVLAILLGPLLPRLAFADQPPTAFSPPSGMPIQVGPGTAGSTESSSAANVDPTTGAFHTSITFDLPTARGAVQPKLALTYNSSGSSFGIGGRGWSLALPSIERHNPSGPPQFANDPPPGGAANPALQDEFTFGGAPLVEICFVAAGGQCTALSGDPFNALSQPPSFVLGGGWHYYRLQTETDLLQRFFWSADHKTWVVQDKTGATSEYSAAESTVSGIPFRWNLTRSYDSERFSSSVASGAPPTLPVPNLVSYVWAQMMPANGVPLFYLTDIYDTPKVGDTAPATSSFAHHTHLVYTQPAWTPSIIAPPWKALPTFVLSRVDVTSQDLSATGRQQVRRYYLTYTSFATATSDGPPAVASVQLEGNCSGAGGWVSGTKNNTEVNGQLPDPSKSAKCLPRPATTFTYAPIVTNLQGEAGFTPQGVVLPGLTNSGLKSPLLFDIDNNGLPDLLEPGSGGKVFLNNGTSGFVPQTLAVGTPSATPSPFNAIGQLTQGQFIQTGHFQMDGRIDMVWTDVAAALKIVPPTYQDPKGNSGKGNAFLYDDNPVNYQTVTISGGSAGTPWTLTPATMGGSFNLSLQYPNWVEPTAAQGGPGLEPGCSGGWAFSPPGSSYSASNFDEVMVLGSEGAIGSVDIDGDGLSDLLTLIGFTEQVETPQSCAAAWGQYAVRFSKRGFDYSYAPFFGASASSATTGARTDLCIAGLSGEGQNASSATANTFADVDGDGIVDFVRWGTTTTTWWPGHGDGVFGLCPADLTANGDIGGLLECACSAAVGGVELAVGIPAGTVAALHDVTGDGLGDVIISGPYGGEFSVYPNMGSSPKGVPTFGPAIPVTVNALLGWSGSATPSAFYFADMNGSGVDDIIVQETPAGGSGSAATALGYVDLYTDPGSPMGKQSLRPGLLTDINNGLGLKTHVTYATTVQLGNAATPTWTSPQQLHVVASLTTSDLTSDSYTTSYTYSGPVFDGHDNRFLGFQKVRETTPGTSSQLMNTENTYFYAACTSPGNVACAVGMNYPAESYRGLLTLTEVFDGGSTPTYLSTTHHSYQGLRLATGYGHRPVTRIYEAQTDTFLYDTSQFASSSATTSIADVDLDPSFLPVAVPVRGTVARHLQKAMALDAAGNITTIVDHGDVGDVSSTPPDPVITQSVSWGMPTQVDKTNNWIWRPLVVSTGASASDLTARTTTFGYDPQGNVTDVTRTLAGTVGLVRSSLGVGVPSGASAASGTPHVEHITYDSTGMGVPLNVQTYPSSSAPARCTEYSYDPAYFQLRTAEIMDVGGCNSAQVIATNHVFDRVLGVEITTIAPAGGHTAATYDGFGRLATVAKPDPTTGLPATALTAQTQIAYTDVVGTGGYGQLVHTKLPPDPAGHYPAYDTYAYLDAFGRTIQVVSTSDTTGQWILSGQVQRNARGRVVAAYVPHFATAADPTALYSPAQPAALATSAAYDPFGRVTQTADIDGTVTSSMRYHPLSVESRDAEQVLPSSVHYGAYVLTTRDGHRRTVQVDEHEHTAAGVLSTIMTYQATGETTLISRSGTNSSGIAVSYTRLMQYDTLGRIVRNVEPNTGSWTYAYNDLGDLVATADARGCGKNLSYDGAGRLLSEDFSPCQAAPLQMAYTSPSSNGDGTEAFYAYEGGALQTGALSDVSDRSSHVHFTHDLRGRLTRVDRRLAAPGTDATMALSVPSALSTRYSSATFSTSTAYDDRDRAQTQSTGATNVDLLATDNTSNVTGSYSPRGLLESVTSSYGAIISSTVVEADGRPDSVTYADHAQTTISYSYGDKRRRLTEAKIWRTQPFPGKQGSYAPPDTTSAPPTQQVVVADDVIPLNATTGYAAYDTVGNPTQITDARPETVGGVTQWPSGYEPVSRSFTYDDSYRLLTANQTFPNSTTDVFQPPAALATVTTSPVPLTTGGNRVLQQAFSYDGLGNTRSSADDSQTFLDRSLGTVTPGTPTNTLAPGPNQLASATLGSSTSGNAGNLNATYDQAGNMVQLVVLRNGTACTSTTGCNQLFRYDWDEVGRLSRARRFDFVGGVTCTIIRLQKHCVNNPLPSNYAYPSLPTVNANADVSYAYDAGGTRVLRASVHAGQTTTYSAEIFPSLRLNHAQWLGSSGAYDDSSTTEAPYLTLGSATFGRVVYNPQAPNLPSKTEIPYQHVFLELTDSLGSTTAVIDKDTSELVERSTYLSYGVLESDYRPDRWMMSDGTALQSFAEPYKFTGKEDDVEIGLTYFGARYYSSQLGVWISPDPLAVHAAHGDLNPYAYVRGRVTSSVDPTGLDGEDDSGSGNAQGSGVEMVCACCGDCGWNTTQAPTVYGPVQSVFAFSSEGIGNAAVNQAGVLAFNSGVEKNSTVIAGTGVVFGIQAIGLAIATGAPAYTAIDNALGAASQAATQALNQAVGKVIGGVLSTLAAAFGAGGSCFSPDTLVATCEDGAQPIGALREHDRVLAQNEDGVIECREVVRTFEHVADDLAVVVLGQEGEESETLHTTLGHRFWVNERGWTHVRDLLPGDSLRSRDGQNRAVISASPEAGSASVFNLEVEGDHTYFVGASETLVHNNGCGDEAAEAGEELAASSSTNASLLKNQLMSEEIAGGHAFDKHVLQQGEFPGISTRGAFSNQIESFLNDSETIMRNLSNGRTAYWNDSLGTVLIRNPAAADGGTFFSPTAGASYFWGLQ